LIREVDAAMKKADLAVGFRCDETALKDRLWQPEGCDQKLWRTPKASAVRSPPAP
jgi:hypothetical protein